jgi:predicted ester cyclase
MSEENKALVRRWFAEVDKGNPTIEDELLPPDYIDHDPPLPGMASGREGVKQANRILHAAFPDTVHTIEDQVAESDKVVTRLSGRGTFTGSILGLTPNGQVVTIKGIAIHRIADGKLVEHWAVADKLSFLQQLGALPPLT